MIISHKYKYLFVELPRTGSSAIADELCNKYDGKKIISKHAKYTDFFKNANTKEKSYFVFSCIRNPFDRVISEYEKLKNDRMNDQLTYSGSLLKIKTKNYLNYIYLNSRFQFVQKHKNFTKFLNRYYWFPYDDWSSLNHHEFDFLIRFENLENDFNKVLKRLDISQDGKIARINVTTSKRDDIDAYFDNEKARRRAVRSFGPFMEKWGYKFSEKWSNTKILNFDRFLYGIMSELRKIFWKYISYRKFKKENYEY